MHGAFHLEATYFVQISTSLKTNGPPYSFSRNGPFDGTNISSEAIFIYLKTGQVKNFQRVQIGGHVEEEFIQHQERMLQCLE